MQLQPIDTQAEVLICGLTVEQVLKRAGVRLTVEGKEEAARMAKSLLRNVESVEAALKIALDRLGK